MRIGLMVGSDKERSRADRLAGLLDDGKAAESDGFASFWIPQVPGYLDAMTAVALLGQVTDRIEIGTAVVPIQTRHPLIMAQQALTTQVACSGRFTLGIGPSHHWIVTDQLGPALRPPGAAGARLPRSTRRRVRGPGAVAVENDTYRVHSPIDVTDSFDMPVLLAALGPAMLRIAGERAGGTILWMADERAIGDYVVPRITEAATDAGRTGMRVVAGVPVALCSDSEVDDARAYASEVLGHADFSPNYVRLLEHGDARRRRRHHGRGRRINHPRPAAPLPRRGRHRPRRPGGAARTGRARTSARRGAALKSSSRRCFRSSLLVHRRP